MIVACLKWTSIEHDDDQRFAGVSPADRATLETALRLGEHLDMPVLALSAGTAGCERAFRDALACGAEQVLRVDAPATAPSSDVGAALADAAGSAQIVVCGDHSLDRGSGSVPAYIAHHRRAAQALGLVSLDIAGSSASDLRGVRRLDGGRREVLAVPVPCVVSVESSVATLRRAPLRSSALAAESALVPVSNRVAAAGDDTTVGAVTPFRPRARVLAPPHGADALDRVRQLTDMQAMPAHGETIELASGDAAQRIVATLREWGYLL